MRHFQSEEIQQYKEGVVTADLKQEITAHLAVCEQCQEEFLALVSTAEVSRAAELLSSDFTDKVITRVTPSRGDVKAKSRKYMSGKRQSLLLYYVGAAVLTLIFVSNGLFQKIIDVTPSMMLLSAQEGHERMEMFEAGGRETRFDLPQKAVEQAALWMESFEAPKEKEEEVR